jgi:hypothetical protein
MANKQSRNWTDESEPKADLKRRSALERDPLLGFMRARGIPLTRENYLDLAYPDGLPDPWTAELEGQLPIELRETSEGD